MKKTVRKRRYYEASQDAIWEAITDSVALSSWFMEADFTPEVGYRFTFKDKPQGGWDGLLHGEVLKVDQPVQLEYTWAGSQMTSITIVKWQLRSQGQGTMLELEHSGFDGFRNVVIGLFHQLGWNKYFNQLAEHLDRSR